MALIIQLVYNGTCSDLIGNTQPDQSKNTEGAENSAEIEH